MYVALLANTAWLDEELQVFRHLVVGLIDEQVRVVQVVPTDLSEEESLVFGQRLTWRDSRWRLMRRRRLAALAEQLQAMGVTVIHALDGRVWSGALRLAHALNCAAVFTANSHYDVPQAQRMARQMDGSRMAITPSTEPLTQAIHEKVDASNVLVERIVPGIRVPDGETAPFHARDPEAPRTIVITGNGRYDPDYEALCAALPGILKDFPNTQFFLDGMGTEQHQLWQAAQRLNLLANLSLVPRKLGHRELLLRADVLIQPQALGRSRSISLQAMAAGKPVIARADPWLDYLIDERTAWLVHDTNAEHWQRCIARALREADAVRQLSDSARQWVKEHYSVSRQVDQIRMLYHRVSGEGIRFPG